MTGHDSTPRGTATLGARLKARAKASSRRIRARPALFARRSVALGLVLGAVLVAANARWSPGEPTVDTLVTAHDLAGGSTLRPGDVSTVPVPRSLRPSGALDQPAQAEGRLLAGAARAGEPLTDARLVAAGNEHRNGPASATVPIRLADGAVADLLYPGARVDVVTAGEPGRRVLAAMATVATVRARDPAGPRGPVAGFTGPQSGALVLVSVGAEVAASLAAASLKEPVAVTLR